MANALASALVVDIATEQAITVLQNRLAPLRAFSTDFSMDVVAPLQKLQVPIAAAGSAVTTNPSSFDTGDTTVNAAEVTMVHFSKGFGLTSTEINQGHRLAHQMRISLGVLADAIIDAALVPVTTTNYGVATVTTDANFVSTGMPALWAALKNGTKRALVIDGSLFSKLLPTTTQSFMLGQEGAYGWDGGIFLNNRWTGAVTNAKGIAVSPEAIAVATALPKMEDAVAKLMLESTTITLPDLGISIQFNIWGSTVTRALRASFDVAFGAKEADTSALKIVTFA